jgi:hypothetical protein
LLCAISGQSHCEECRKRAFVDRKPSRPIICGTANIYRTEGMKFRGRPG